MSGYKKISTNHQKKTALAMCDQLLCTNMDDVILCTLSPNHNIHEEKGVYQRRTMYALSQKVCWKCIFLRPGDPNLLTHQTVKKLNLWEKTAIDKSAWIKA